MRDRSLNFWANGKITASLTNWRWGYGAYVRAFPFAPSQLTDASFDRPSPTFLHSSLSFV